MIRTGIALFFLAGALFHGLALTWPSLSVVPEDPATHVLFALLNLWLCEAALSWRPRFPLYLAALTVHQVVVHGVMLVRGVGVAQDLAVLIGLVLVWVLMFVRRATEYSA
jgi:hypothetical protein